MFSAPPETGHGEKTRYSVMPAVMDLYYPLHGSNLLCNAWLQPCVLTTYNSLPASHFERAATLQPGATHSNPAPLRCIGWR